MQVTDLPLPGNATRLDYQSLDPQRNLLFIAHLGDSQVIVVDTKARRVLGTIPKVSNVHGVLAVPELKTVYASATGTNELVVIDESSLKIVGRTGGGVYPDGIAFDPVTRRIFVSDEHGRTDTVIDTRSNKRIATIELGGEVGNTQYDPVSRHIFANVQTLRQLVEIDPSRNAIVKRYSLGDMECIGNHGLLIDPDKRRAFITCEESGTLLWLDMKSMRVVQGWPTGEDPDVLALDTKTNRLFIAAESGYVSVFSDAARVAPIAQAYLAPAAHTVAVDARTQLIYFPLENTAGRPVLRIMEERR
ncbi:MAG TPA: YncE family protein [Candidatus Nitrosotalea sp.]|nr:YncE family protein [Candidatus Nitrosotalea sp.]